MYRFKSSCYTLEELSQTVSFVRSRSRENVFVNGERFSLDMLTQLYLLICETYVLSKFKGDVYTASLHHEPLYFNIRYNHERVPYASLSFCLHLMLDKIFYPSEDKTAQHRPFAMVVDTFSITRVYAEGRVDVVASGIPEHNIAYYAKLASRSLTGTDYIIISLDSIPF